MENEGVSGYICLKSPKVHAFNNNYYSFGTRNERRKIPSKKSLIITTIVLELLYDLKYKNADHFNNNYYSFGTELMLKLDTSDKPLIITTIVLEPYYLR